MSQYTNNLPLTAGGNILPGRFIAMEAGQESQVIQASGGASEPVMGVCKESSLDAPGLGGSANHSEDTHRVEYYGPGEYCLVEAGAAVTAGDYVMPDANGKAITATTTLHAFGIAVQTAATDGDFIKVQLTNGVYIP